MISVPVNKIIPVSYVDGLGCRTSIFLQKCNISCAYCHNPETQRMCISCGKCVTGCPTGALSINDNKKVIWDIKKCIYCDLCINICPHYASPRITMMTAKEVYEIVKKNIPFIRGITASGGECTLYPEFLEELFTYAKVDGLSCLIDSNGTIDLSIYPGLISKCDGVMLDVKSWDPVVFKNLTSGENNTVKKNLAYLAENDKLEEIRIVCLPGEVDAEEVLHGIINTIDKKTIVIPLKLIKFRRFGVKGRLENSQSPSDEYMVSLQQKASKLGFGQVSII